MCTLVSTMNHSSVSKNIACTSPSIDNFYVSPGIAPALGQFLYTDPGCSTPVPNGWYIDYNVDPDVVYVVTGGSGEITSVESCSSPTPTPTPTPTSTPTITPTPTPTPTSSSVPLIPDLTASFNLTGECLNDVFSVNSGRVQIFPSGGVPPYSVECESGQSILPVTGIVSGGNALITGLSADTYTFKLTDSSGGVNDSILINVNVDDCFIAGLINVTDTTCGSSNGSFEVSVTTDSYPLSVNLYQDTGGGYIFYNNYQVSNSIDYITNLPSGDYYADIYDFGGASATTISNPITISGSPVLDYSLVVTNNSNCGIPSGKVEITGLTVGTYTYLWSNGGTDDFISGLTASTYSVTVTDVYGCELTKTATVLNQSTLGVISITTTQPGCLSSNGEVTVNISGGTGPYYFSGSTGESNTTSSSSYTFTNVSAGSFEIFIQDSNLCGLYTNTSLVGGGGLTSVSISQIPTNCGNYNNVDIFVNGVPPFTYYYSGETVGSSTFVTNSTNYTIQNLPQGFYNISVSASTCGYQTGITVNTTPKFSISATTTGATCGLQNGSVLIEVGSGYTGVLDYVLSSGQSILDVNLSSYTFSNLYAGSYNIKVTDQDGCYISQDFDITTSGEFGFLLNTTNCVLGDDGTASVSVYAGQPPFTYSWSNGETTETVSNLTGGTYTVTVTDSNGCFETKNFVIYCNSKQVTNYNIVPICENVFITTTGNKRSLMGMLNEGFLDQIPSGATSCQLNQSIFTCNVSVTGYSDSVQFVSGGTVPFYTGYTLTDVPSDSLWVETIQNILSTIPEIESYEISMLNNSIKIYSNCNTESDPFNNGYIDISLEIDYNINCI